MSNFWYWYKEMIIGTSIGLVVLAVLFYGLYVATENERIKWEAFYVEHNCQIVGKKKGKMQTGVGPIIGSNGGTTVIITSTPDSTGYLCDDGVTYWR